MIKWVVGILQKDGYILIGKLRKENPLIPRMEWTFPFKKIQEGESPRKTINKFFNEELKLNADVKKFLIKYTPSENAKIEQYFYELKCNFGNPVSSKDFSKFMWIKPTQILKYFETSISKEIMDYLQFLEKKGKGLIID